MTPLVQQSGQPHALVTGVTGQDGYYLARFLLARGDRVTGAVRDLTGDKARALRAELSGLELIELNLSRLHQVGDLLRSLRPDRIFHLAGRSSVAETWRDPEGTRQVNQQAADLLLEAVAAVIPEAHFILAGSGDCFDHAAAGERGIDPLTPFLCTNPYAESKAAAMRGLRERRERSGLRASIAVLMNHTSPRRPLHFVERKIVREAVLVSRGHLDRLTLGSLDTRRDWSWAEDIVEGLARLGDSPTTGDYLFASGVVRTTRDWVEETFARLGLSMEQHLRLDAAQLHPGDRPHMRGNIEKAERELGWKPKTDLSERVARLVEYDMQAIV